MQNVGVGFGWVRKVSDVAFKECDCGVFSEVRRFFVEGGLVPGEDGCADIQIEFTVGVKERFNEPVAEEAGAAGDEDASVAEGEE